MANVGVVGFKLRFPSTQIALDVLPITMITII